MTISSYSLTDDINRLNRIRQGITTDCPLILASASPRRKELLQRLGLKFTIVPSQAEEDDVEGSPKEKVCFWAMLKAEAVAARQLNGIIIGADTIVVLKKKVLGKPADEVQARKMLTQLSGQTHRVITGLALLNTRNGQRISEAIETKVSFRNLSAKEIDRYIATKEPLDKAGAYGIQGQGANLVSRIEGCYTNVVGLPVSSLLKFLGLILDLPA